MRQYLYIALIMIGNITIAQEGLKPPISMATSQAGHAFPNAPQIYFAETIHDFGAIKKGSPVNYKFLFTNTGKEPLVIHNCFAGCICTTVRFPKKSVMPGEKGFITVHYDSTRVGAIKRKILISSNAEKPVVFLTIRGVINDIAKKENTHSKADTK